MHTCAAEGVRVAGQGMLFRPERYAYVVRAYDPTTGELLEAQTMLCSDELGSGEAYTQALGAIRYPGQVDVLIDGPIRLSEWGRN